MKENIPTNIDFYLINYESNYSLMNITFKDEMTENDYYEYIIDEFSKYRIDKVAKKTYNNSKYYIFITLSNNDCSIESLIPGRKLIIPKLEYIQYYVNKYRKINGVR